MPSGLDLELSSALAKCRIEDLHQHLRKWGYFDPEELEPFRFKNTRTGYYHTVLDTIQNKEDFSAECIGELDLICLQSNAKKKTWTIYRFEDKEGNGKAQQYLDNVRYLKKKLKNQLLLYFDANLRVSVRVLEGAVWVRLYLRQSRNGSARFSNSDVVYLVHYPKTHHVAISHFKEPVRQFLFQSLTNTFGYRSMKNLLLSGHDLDSLFQLSLNKKGQGAFTRHQLQQIQNLPESIKRPKKRKVREYEDDPDIIREDADMKKQRLEVMEVTFGPHEQPALEILEFKYETKYKGKDKPSESHQHDHPLLGGSVKFEGHNVLEGIRNLVECGLADLPLPPYLSKVHSLARNHFVLKGSTSRNVERSRKEQHQSAESRKTARGRSNRTTTEKQKPTQEGTNVQQSQIHETPKITRASLRKRAVLK